MELGRTWDGNNPGFLGEQPRKCDLRRRCIFLFAEFAKHIYERQICLAGFWSKAGKRASEISLPKLGVFVHLSGQETFSQWTIGYEANSQLLQCRQNFRL